MGNSSVIHRNNQGGVRESKNVGDLQKSTKRRSLEASGDNLYFSSHYILDIYYNINSSE